MPDDTPSQDLTPVVLHDRAGAGGFEFLFDHRVRRFRPGVTDMVTHADVARHVFRHEHLKVWTTDGDFVHRVSLRDAPGSEGLARALARELGDEILDDAPITIDTARLETSNTDQFDLRTGAMKPVPIRATPLRDRQGAGSRIV